MRRISFAFAVALVVGAVAAGPAGAQVQSTCLAKKTKCASKKAFALLKCEWKAETPGSPPDPNDGGCVDKATEKFDGGGEPTLGCFEKLENGPTSDCVTVDDTGALETIVDQCVANVVSIIDPGEIDQTKCGAAKKKCAAKKLKKLLKCHAKAQTPGKPTDPNTDECLDKVNAKFDGGADPENGCVVKLETNPRGDCAAPIGNQTQIGAAVDDCVADIIGALTTAAPTTTSTSSSTSSSAVGSTSTSTPVSSTSTTSAPSGTATCGANSMGLVGIDVTVSLAYNEQAVGRISGAHFRVNYVPPLTIPGSLNATSVRARVTKLDSTSGISGSSILDNDTNSDTVDDALELNATEPGADSLGPGAIFRLRYDCPSGQAISSSAVNCALSQAVDGSGAPFPPEIAAQINCTLALSNSS